VVGSVAGGWWGEGSAGVGDLEGFLAVHLVLSPDLGSDAVAEGVGGVLGRQRAEVGRFGEQVGDVGPVAGELGEVRGEGGQGRVAGGGGCGGSDPGLPFADSGLAGLQRVVEVALGVAFGRGVFRRAGGSQVGVGGLVGGPPLLDVGDQLGVETGEVFGPPGAVVGCVLARFVGELSGEFVAAGEVVLPVATCSSNSAASTTTGSTCVLMMYLPDRSYTVESTVPPRASEAHGVCGRFWMRNHRPTCPVLGGPEWLEGW